MTTVTFKLALEPIMKTLTDIQHLLQQYIDEQSVYVHIVVVRGGMSLGNLLHSI